MIFQVHRTAENGVPPPATPNWDHQLYRKFTPRKGSPQIKRRDFIAQTMRSLIGWGAASLLGRAAAADVATVPAPSHRIGAVAYTYSYALGLFAYKNRLGTRMDNVGFVEAVHHAGGNVAQLYGPTLLGEDAAGLKRIRTRAEELDISLEVHGGTAQQATYPKIMEQTAALGAKIVGCSFGFMLRPDKITTLAAWDAHLGLCETRLRELIPYAKRLGLVIGVENHLDFSLEEMHGLMKRLDTPQVGVLFDVGNWLGTLDDPTEAAERLGPFTVATHYKDFAVEEMPFGFRLTMVALGCGSLDLPGITAALYKKLRPEANVAIEMINGQQLDIKWLERDFWPPFHTKNAAEVAATLNHIRRQKISVPDLRRLTDIDAMPNEEHLQFEARQAKRCIAYLQKLMTSSGQPPAPIRRHES